LPLFERIIFKIKVVFENSNFLSIYFIKYKHAQSLFKKYIKIKILCIFLKKLI